MKRLIDEAKYMKKHAGLLFLALPGLGLFFLFNYIPLYGLILPFKNYNYADGLWGSPWSGFANFRYLIAGDAWKITVNTLLFNAIFIVIGLITGIAFALMLYELSAKFVKVYQTMLFIPFFLSWVVVSYVGLALMDMQYGLLNQLLESMGGEPVLWYNTPKLWFAILPVANLWKGIGYGTLIYYTALLGVDPELYEAAALDGASRLRQIWHISLPMIKPLAIMLTLLNIGNIIRADFGLFFNFTRDSTMLYPVTDVIDTYVYRALRRLGDIGMSSAAGFYQSVVGFILVVIANATVKKIDPDSALF
ncbi:MAG: ABC transporter permease subunit [Lachnospiraceae bacterium]|nr:ABC transporter permease subunit [Lachnospiraceae bacterium]